MPQKTKKVKKKSTVRVVASGRLYITATLNNTLISFTDEDGNVIFSGSAGASGFKGTRKSTPYASTIAIESVVNKMKDQNIRQIEVFLKGPGTGRDAALRVLRTAPFKITKIADVTPLPHNGPRPKKQRRA